MNNSKIHNLIIEICNNLNHDDLFYWQTEGDDNLLPIKKLTDIIEKYLNKEKK